MTATYCVVLKGVLAEGAERAVVYRDFARMTGQSETVVARLFAGVPRVITRNLAGDEAERIVRALTRIGAPATAEAEDAPPEPLELDPELLAEVGAREPAAAPAATAPVPADGGAGSGWVSAPAPLSATAIDEPPREELYRAYLGPNHSEHYLRYFAKRDAGGSALSWNWPAFFVPGLWGIHRRLTAFALVMFVVVNPLGKIIDKVCGEAWAVEIVLMALLGAIPAALADRSVYRRAQRTIAATRHIPNHEERLRAVAREGGVWKHTGGLVLGLICLTIVVIVVLMALASSRPTSSAASEPSPSAAGPAEAPSTAPAAPQSPAPAPSLVRRPPEPPAPRAINSQMVAAYQQQDYAEAWRLANELADAGDPTWVPFADNMRGLVYMARGMPEQAIPYFEAAATACGKCPAVHLNRGANYLALRKWNSAVSALQTAVAEDPGNQRAQEALTKARQGAEAERKEIAWQRYRQEHRLRDCPMAESISGVAECLKQQNALRAQLGY